MKLSQLKKQTGETALVFGPPKVGKTLIAGLLAEHFDRTQMFDLENGIQTLTANFPQMGKAHLLDKIDAVQIPDSRKNPIAIKTMLKVFSGQKLSICNKHGMTTCIQCAKDKLEVTEVELNKFGRNDLVIMDSASQLADSAYAHVMGQQRLEECAKADWDDWGQMGNLLSMVYSQIQQVPYNVVVISHEDMVQMPDKSDKIVPVGGTRNFSKRFAKFFGHVIYCEIVLGKYKQGSSPTYKMNVISGSRSGLILDGDKVTLADLLKSGSLPQTPAGANAPIIAAVKS